MDWTEGEGSSEMEITEIETTSEFLDGSLIFHVVKDAIYFVLYMHQQIPFVLQDMSLESYSLHNEYKELMDLRKTETKAALRRKHLGRMREIKQEIRRSEKLLGRVSSLETALQLMIREIPTIHEVILVVGASPIRPLYVYQMYFSHANAAPPVEADFVKGKTAEKVSKKAIRALISKGAGTASRNLGPTKLFLLVKAPSTLNLPLHFLPKRDFRYCKKIFPFRLRFRSRTQGLKMDSSDHNLLSSRSTGLTDSSSNDLIWFQCRHAIKGLAFDKDALLEEE